MSKAISRQKQFLKQLGHTADDQLTKEQASKLIDQLLATEKASGKTFPCPYCKKPFGPRPKRSATCPACKGKIIHMSGKFYTEEKAGALIQKDLFKEMCSSVKEEVREEWKDEKDIRKQYGDTHFVGYLLQIGPKCTDSKHLNGLLVYVEDAFDAPELLPPYETCRFDSCECEYRAVSSSEVPKGTQVAEAHAAEITSKLKTRASKTAALMANPRGCA